MSEKEKFGGRVAMIMALVGSAIGLGNIWRFPYMLGEGGGAAFVLVYLIFSFMLSVPIFIAESVIGRHSGANCIGAMKKLAPGSVWNILGALSIITPLIIVSYYSVVGGWSLEFFFKSCTLGFSGADADVVKGTFGTFISSVTGPAVCFTVFLAVTCGIVALGVRKGIEKFSKFSIPVLFIMVVLIMVYSLTLDGAQKGVEYLVKPDMSKLTLKTCALALGQSFYSISLGMGIIITYSSYMDKKDNIFFSGTVTAAADVLFALLAGFAIMPAVFAAGIEPSAGPGLIFETLPYIFAKMGAAAPWLSAGAAILFFATVIFAALTSSVSLVEVGVAWLVEEKHMRRPVATLLIFAGTWVAGMLCSLSLRPDSALSILGKPLFDALDLFSSDFLLVAGGMLAVLFVGWKMPLDAFRGEFTNGGTLKFNCVCFDTVRFIIRYLAPVAIGIIFISNFIF